MPGLLLRRYVPLLLGLLPRLLQRCGLLLRGPRAVEDLLEPGEHHVVEVLRREDVDIVAERLRLTLLREVVENRPEQLGHVEPLGVYRMGGDRIEPFYLEIGRAHV